MEAVAIWVEWVKILVEMKVEIPVVTLVEMPSLLYKE